MTNKDADQFLVAIGVALAIMLAFQLVLDWIERRRK